jgi:hypothetical protein
MRPKHKYRRRVPRYKKADPLSSSPSPRIVAGNFLNSPRRCSRLLPERVRPQIQPACGACYAHPRALDLLSSSPRGGLGLHPARGYKCHQRSSRTEDQRSAQWQRPGLAGGILRPCPQVQQQALARTGVCLPESGGGEHSGSSTGGFERKDPVLWEVAPRASGLSGRPTGSKTRSHKIKPDRQAAFRKSHPRPSNPRSLCYQARHFGHLNLSLSTRYHDCGPACLGLTARELP